VIDHTSQNRFKPGHKKLGGRKGGTLNAISPDLRKALIEAADRVGMRGNGEQGLVGYLRWVARYRPRIFIRGLTSILQLENLQGNAAEKPRRTLPEINDWARDYVACKSKAESRSPSSWVVVELMQLAVEDPKSFCKALNDAFLKPEVARHRRARHV
jgi:hypothetical protein